MMMSLYSSAIYHVLASAIPFLVQPGISPALGRTSRALRRAEFVGSTGESVVE